VWPVFKRDLKIKTAMHRSAVQSFHGFSMKCRTRTIIIIIYDYSTRRSCGNGGGVPHLKPLTALFPLIEDRQQQAKRE
jgi:hypothetical protein